MKRTVFIASVAAMALNAFAVDVCFQEKLVEIPIVSTVDPYGGDAHVPDETA